MRIISVEPDLLTEIPFLNAGKGGGSFFTDRLPVHIARVDRLPDDTAAIVVTADLQGRETFASSGGLPPKLLGEVLPSRLSDDLLPMLKLPAGSVGALLAGDFYTVPALDARGGTGDVSAVWDAFGRTFDWVAGVAGNHDLFGDQAARPRLPDGYHFLDGDVVDVRGFRLGGISGIIGNPRRPWRRVDADYVDCLQGILMESPDCIVLHDGPDGDAMGYRGSPVIRQAFDDAAKPLIIRGHSHWPQPLAELNSGLQVLNVDARVVVLVER